MLMNTRTIPETQFFISTVQYQRRGPYLVAFDSEEVPL